jgi:hypothetical protein
MGVEFMRVLAEKGLSQGNVCQRNGKKAGGGFRPRMNADGKIIETGCSIETVVARFG